MFKKPLWQTVWTQPDQTARAVCSGSTLIASILNSSVMLGSYLQQTTSADDIFRCIFTWCRETTGSSKYSLQHLLPFSKWEPEGANSFLYGMENQFYHIGRPPLNVTIFITHVRNLRNKCYSNIRPKLFQLQRQARMLDLCTKPVERVLWFPTMWHFDKSRLRRACAAFF